MRADRLLMIVSMLRVEGQLSAHELAKRLEVSQRTIYRDVDALCAAGVPVVSETGSSGGFSLPKTYNGATGWLHHDDVQSLFVRQSMDAWRSLGMEKTVENAVLKLLGGLSEQTRQVAMAVRDRILLDSVDWFFDESPNQHLKPLQEAVMQDRVIEVVYERGNGEVRDYVLHPYGLVFKAGVWYLVATDAGTYKTFRTSRFHDVKVSEQGFQRNRPFDLQTFWTEWKAAFESSRPVYKATVLVHPEFIPVLPELFGEGIRHESRSAARDLETGWLMFQLTFESIHAATSKVLAMGPSAMVVMPLELRTRVLQCAKSVVDIYQRV